MIKYAILCVIVGFILLAFNLIELFFIFLLLSVYLLIRGVADWFI